VLHRWSSCSSLVCCMPCKISCHSMLMSTVSPGL
jgi:hypothetical protein